MECPRCNNPSSASDKSDKALATTGRRSTFLMMPKDCTDSNALDSTGYTKFATMSSAILNCCGEACSKRPLSRYRREYINLEYHTRLHWRNLHKRRSDYHIWSGRRRRRVHHLSENCSILKNAQLTFLHTRTLIRYLGVSVTQRR